MRTHPQTPKKTPCTLKVEKRYKIPAKTVTTQSEGAYSAHKYVKLQEIFSYASTTDVSVTEELHGIKTFAQAETLPPSVPVVSRMLNKLKHTTFYASKARLLGQERTGWNVFLQGAR